MRYLYHNKENSGVKSFNYPILLDFDLLHL